jgi:hypothetical protein
MDRIIRPDQIDFSDEASAAVMSQSLRYVLPVPALDGGGEALLGPNGETLFDHDKPIVGRGIVFLDPDDQSLEAVPGDASGVILFSPISEDEGAMLSTFIATISARPEHLRLDQLKEIVRYATEDLGLASAHSSTRDYVAQALEPVEDAAARGCGLYRRRRGDICRAVRVAGKGAFLGPGASPQRFVGGVVILKHGDSIRAVQRRSFEITYQFLDGRPARVAQLPTQTPKARPSRTRASTARRARAAPRRGAIQGAHGRQM